MRPKAQPRLDELLQLLLQNKSPVLPRKPHAHTDGTVKDTSVCVPSLEQALSWLAQLRPATLRSDEHVPDTWEKPSQGAPGLGSAGSFSW